MNKQVMFAAVAFAALIGIAGTPVALGDVPLFGSEQPLEIRIEAPIKALRRADKETWMLGKLSHGGTDFDVEFRARGKFRLDMCRMQPLWIKFDKAQVKDKIGRAHV